MGSPDTRKNAAKNNHSSTHKNMDTSKLEEMMKNISDRLENMESKMVTKEGMDIALLMLKDDINQNILRQVEVIENRVEELETNGEELNERVKTLEENQQIQTNEPIDNSYIIKLTEEMEKLKAKVNEVEQQGRKESIRIFGITDKYEDETMEETINLVLD